MTGAAANRCPLCGEKVRHWSWLPSAAHPRIERGRCRGGHRLQRIRGTVIGRWEPAE